MVSSTSTALRAEYECEYGAGGAEGKRFLPQRRRGAEVRPSVLMQWRVACATCGCKWSGFGVGRTLAVGGRVPGGRFATACRIWDMRMQMGGGTEWDGRWPRAPCGGRPICNGVSHMGHADANGRGQVVENGVGLA